MNTRTYTRNINKIESNMYKLINGLKWLKEREYLDMTDEEIEGEWLLMHDPDIERTLPKAWKDYKQARAWFLDNTESDILFDNPCAVFDTLLNLYLLGFTVDIVYNRE